MNETIDWSLLNESIRRGQCVLVLGPNTATVPDAGDQALSQRLAETLADDIADQAEIIDRSDLTHVSQLYLKAVGSRRKLELKVRDFLSPFASETTELHRNLAAIPFRFCVNMNLDRFFHNALEQNNKKPTFDYYNFRTVREGLFDNPDEISPLIFNLFGTSDDPQSMVLTEQDLLELLTKIATRDPPLQSLVSSMFADKENSFLFLGFRFERWHARILLHILQTYDHNEPSLALVRDDTFQSSERKCAAVYFAQAFRFEFCRITPLEFSRELAKSYQGGAASAPAPPEPPIGAPSVFLCYRRMDREAVITVEEALNRGGIHTWRDEQKLRGGDEWDRVLRDVLSKHVDYVVVLQTPNMVSQVKSYCKLEIDIALDVQRKFGQFKYLIPTRLLPCDGFDRLAHLQTEDLTHPEGIDRLIESIKVDWISRKATEKEGAHGRGVV